MDPIPFDILYVSSEAEYFRVFELLNNAEDPGAPHGCWQTVKEPQYPQSLVLRFPGDIELSQVQILSHECKIASKVEFRVYSCAENGVILPLDGVASSDLNMPSFRDVRFAKLGSVNFDNNEKSKYRSKERKTVHLKTMAYFLKLNFHRAHPNPLNQHHQVGVYSILCLGKIRTIAPWHADPDIRAPPEEVTPPVSSRPLPVTKAGEGMLPQLRPRRKQSAQQQQQQPTSAAANQELYARSPQPSHKYGGAPLLDPVTPPQRSILPPVSNQYRSPPVKQSTAHPHDLPVIPESIPTSQGYTYRSNKIIEFDDFYTRRTAEFVRLKARAVDDEDFEAAKSYKDSLHYLHSAAQKIYSFEREKVQCIYDEDFDGAKRMKMEMDNLLEDLYGAVSGGLDKYMGLAKQNSNNNNNNPQQSQPNGPSASGVSPARNRPNPSAANKNVVDMPSVSGSLPAGKNAFEDEPVRSKYAIAMAQRREEHPDEEEGGEEGTGGADPSAAAEEGERGSEHGEEEEDQPSTQDVHHHQNHPQKKQGGGSVPSAAPTTNAALEEPVDLPPEEFDVKTFAKWEQDLQRAIHDIAGEDALAAPVAANGPYAETADSLKSLGAYMSACLLSKRWKLREAAIKAVTLHVTQLFNHIPTANVIAVVLKYFDAKNFGLQDTIGSVFIACCELVQQVLSNQYDCLKDVLPSVLNLLPRFIARAGDAAQKTRDESAATVLCYATCADVGPFHVVNAVLSDPVDQDKRRIPAQNHRVHAARLSLLQSLLQQHKSLTLTSQVLDLCMNRLLLLGLNHSSSEVRDLAVTVTVSLVDANYDLSKMVNSINNAAIKATISGALEGKGKLKRNSSAGKKRNNSAPRSRSRTDDHDD